jgi:hypothetical protein
MVASGTGRKNGLQPELRMGWLTHGFGWVGLGWVGYGSLAVGHVGCVLGWGGLLAEFAQNSRLFYFNFDEYFSRAFTVVIN